MIRALKAAAVLGTAYIALLACPSGTVTPSASASASVAAVTTPTSAPSSAAPSETPAATGSAAASASAAASESASPSAAATTAAATEAPTAAPTTASTNAPTAAPSATPAPTATPVPTPTPSPTPVVPYAGYIFAPNASGPVLGGFTRYGATVVDASTGAPVVGACAYTGPPAGCPPKGANHTDANGFFAVDLPAGSAFAFTIEHPSYHAIIQVTITAGTSVTLKMTHL